MKKVYYRIIKKKYFRTNFTGKVDFFYYFKRVIQSRGFFRVGNRIKFFLFYYLKENSSMIFFCYKLIEAKPVLK